LVQGKSRKRAAKSPANASVEDATSKRRNTDTVSTSAIDSQMAIDRVIDNSSDRKANTLYIKGVNYNFASAIKKKPIQVQAAILKICPSSNPRLWKTSGESLRITVENQLERQRMLSLDEISGQPVEVTPPWSSARPADSQIARPNMYAQALSKNEKT
jgi:hypothetical protein